MSLVNSQDALRDTIIVSHATHQDDYLAGWLASKLQRMGYKVFIDLENLRAGDTFFTVIQPMIQKTACRFITLNTQHYLKKAEDENSGVRKEINAAAAVTSIKNFIIPVRFDSSDFSSFPMDYVGRNGIDFYNRWGQGLEELLDELEKLGTPRNAEDINPLQLWYTAIKVRNKVIQRDEKIHSNWFSISLPEFIYVHKPTEIDKAQLSLIPATTILESNHIICFASTETVSSLFELIDSKKISTADFIANEKISVGDLIIVKPYDKIKNLLNKSFRSHCRWRGLKMYKQAGEKEIFYFQFKDEKPVSYSLKKYGKTRTQLVGNKWEKNWHYAISAKAELKPFPHYRLSYHVIFTDAAFNPFEEEEQQVLRKRFSPTLYNKKAFEFQIAAMSALSRNRDSDCLEIRIDYNKSMLVKNFPETFSSHVSYIEP